MTDCDLLVTGGLLVDAEQGVHEQDALCVMAGRIVEVGSAQDLAARYNARRTIDASGKIVLPGLINAHTHASATLFRGYAADPGAGRSDD